MQDLAGFTTVAFDVDGTLITLEDQPRWGVIETLRFFERLPMVRVIVWSGGDESYARMWGRRLFLPPLVTYMDKPKLIRWDEKSERVTEPLVDIAFDDLDVNYGKVNIRV